ncbi:MAG: hypothetical protein HY537_10695 [Deltaproteobacteria bacterium]|nr:hypothetical protein [Deltaproteobacteria bacterium]
MRKSKSGVWFYVFAFALLISCAQVNQSKTEQEKSKGVQSAYVWLVGIAGMLGLSACGSSSSSNTGSDTVAGALPSQINPN